MMAYQCDNEALDDIKQYGMVDTTHAASDGCKRQARLSSLFLFKLVHFLLIFFIPLHLEHNMFVRLVFCRFGVFLNPNQILIVLCPLLRRLHILGAPILMLSYKSWRLFVQIRPENTIYKMSFVIIRCIN